MVQHNSIDHTGVPGVSSGSVATDAIWDAAGDLAVGTGANTAARLAVGAADTVLKSNGTTAAWAHPVLTTSEANAGSDTTMTNANQFYDGPSVTITGTYLLIAGINFRTTAAADFTAKLWNGTTVESSGSMTVHANTYTGSITLAGIITTSGSETWKISVAANGTTGTLKAATVNNGAGNNASWIRAIKIA